MHTDYWFMQTVKEFSQVVYTPTFLLALTLQVLHQELSIPLDARH